MRHERPEVCAGFPLHFFVSVVSSGGQCAVLVGRSRLKVNPVLHLKDVGIVIVAGLCQLGELRHIVGRFVRIQLCHNVARCGVNAHGRRIRLRFVQLYQLHVVRVHVD